MHFRSAAFMTDLVNLTESMQAFSPSIICLKKKIKAVKMCFVFKYYSLYLLCTLQPLSIKMIQYRRSRRIFFLWNELR